MNKILFLTSSEGGALKFIVSCIEKNFLFQYRVSAVIGDRACHSVDFAKTKGIDTYIVEYNEGCRDDLLKTMREIDFDIAITNIHKILDMNIVREFSGKLINLHPSLLPAFKGFRAIENSINYGVRFIGTTVHEVNEKMDAGKILAQSVMPLEESVSLPQVNNQMFRAWCLNLLNVLMRRIRPNAADITTSYQKSIFNPPLCFETICFDEAFWAEIKSSHSSI